jgi:hypothetical protein
LRRALGTDPPDRAIASGVGGELLTIATLKTQVPHDMIQHYPV